MNEPATKAGAAVVVIDDSLIMRRLLEAILEKAGRAVHAFESGAQALARLAELRPSIVLLDACLPDVDGPTVLAEIRRLGGERPPAVVFVTGLAEAELPAADGYVAKPFTPARVMDAIAAVEEARFS